MDGEDRTVSTEVEIPQHLLPALRHAACLGLERATEYSEYTDEVQEEILEAARLHAVLHLGQPDAVDVATLADNAIRWMELPSDSPAIFDEQFRLAGDLGRLRDAARLAAWPAEALHPESREPGA